jgi:hypothetical protein
MVMEIPDIIYTHAIKKTVGNILLLLFIYLTAMGFHLVAEVQQ